MRGQGAGAFGHCGRGQSTAALGHGVRGQYAAALCNGGRGHSAAALGHGGRGQGSAAVGHGYESGVQRASESGVRRLGWAASGGGALGLDSRAQQMDRNDGSRIDQNRYVIHA